MPDVSKYAARDRRAAEIHRDVRLTNLACQIPEIPAHTPFVAFWLFCRYSGFRKITDISWFDKHMEKGETLEHFRARLWCDGCKKKGCFAAGAPWAIIPTHSELRYLRFDFRDREIRKLFIDDQWRDLYVSRL